MAVCSAINEDILLYMSKKQSATAKKTLSEKIDNLTPVQEEITDNAALKYLQGSEFLDDSCHMLWDLIGGDDPKNHMPAKDPKTIPEGYMGIFFQPDEYLFKLVKARFDVTLSQAKRESELRTEEKNSLVEGYIRKTDEEIKVRVNDFINNSWKRIYKFFREPQNHIWQVDFFLPNDMPYAAPKELTGEQKWVKDLSKEITSMKKVITKLRDAVANNRKVKNNKTLSPEQVTASTIHGAETRLDELRELIQDIENIVS